VASERVVDLLCPERRIDQDRQKLSSGRQPVAHWKESAPGYSPGASIQGGFTSGRRRGQRPPSSDWRWNSGGSAAVTDVLRLISQLRRNQCREPAAGMLLMHGFSWRAVKSECLGCVSDETESQWVDNPLFSHETVARNWRSVDLGESCQQEVAENGDSLGVPQLLRVDEKHVHLRAFQVG
jgi:hypothetical protein